MAPTFGPITENTKATGKTAKCTAKAHLLGQMVQHIQDIMIMTKRMVGESFIGLTARNIEGTGKMANNMA